MAKSVKKKGNLNFAILYLRSLEIIFAFFGTRVNGLDGGWKLPFF